MFYLSARNDRTKGTTMTTHYRGFRITFSDQNNAYNARPVNGNPELVPVAARSMDELTPVLDFQYDEIARKAAERAEEKTGIEQIPDLLTFD